MHRSILAFLLVILLAGTARGDFRFVQISDIHVGAGNNAEIDAAMFREISRLTPAPAFVVNTGDVCEKGTPEEYQRFQEICAELKCPQYIAPGNHDVRWNPLGKEGFTRGARAPLYQAWDHEQFHFVTLDATVLLEHWGHISQDQLDWLADDLKKVGTDRPVIIGFHHWIGREKVMVDNEQALLDVVAPYNVVLWLQGHGHSDIQWNINGAPAIMQRGLYQGGFAVIDVQAGQMKITRHTYGQPKNAELLKSRGASVDLPEPRIHPVMTVSLARKPAPKWLASAQVQNDKLVVHAERGSLPAGAKVDYRLDTQDPLAMTASADAWKTELPLANIVAGEHTVTVQATLPDGRAFQKPVNVKIPGSIAPLWETNVGSAVQSRLVRDGDLLYVTTMGGDLVALGAADGKERFRFKTGGPIFSTIHLDKEVAYFGSADHHVYAINAADGSQKWKAEVGGAVLAGPAVAENVVCVGSVDKNIYGLDARDGKVLWKVQGQNMFQSKAATDGRHFFVGGWDNHFRCMDAASGAVVWDQKLGKSGGPIFSAFAPAITSPAVGADKVFVSTNDGILHALKTADGSEVWRVDWKKMGYSSPIYRDDKVYCALSDEGKVFCADANSGHVDWVGETGAEIYDSSFAFGGGNVFIGCVNGVFSALDASSGKMMWQYRLGAGHVLDSPATDDKLVFISSMSGKVTALPLHATR
jgi:outer membrane protein assembly factor BamB